MRHPRALLWEIPLLVVFFAVVLLLSRGLRRQNVLLNRLEDRFALIAKSAAVTRIGSGGLLPTVDIAPARNPEGGWDVHIVLDKAILLGGRVSSGSTLPRSRALLFLDGELLADAEQSPVRLENLTSGTHVFAVLLTDANHKAFASGSQLVTRILVGTADSDGFRMTDKR
jgi:hypothetical protein